MLLISSFFVLSLFFLLEGSSRGIPSGRFSFKWLDYGRTYNNNNNNNTFKYTAYLFWIFCFFSPPRICWITPAPQEAAQGSLSLFREPWHDKSHLMSVSVSFPFLAADFICVKKKKMYVCADKRNPCKRHLQKQTATKSLSCERMMLHLISGLRCCLKLNRSLFSKPVSLTYMYMST